jgi:hypothetical protein
MNTTMTHVTVAAQPGWFLTVFTNSRWYRALRTDHRLGDSKNDIVQRTCNQISDPNHGGEQEQGFRLRYLGHQTA